MAFRGGRFRQMLRICLEMKMFIRSRPEFGNEAEKAEAVLRAARVVAGDETGVRIEGTNSNRWVFHGKDAVVHQPDYSRAARVVDEMMDGRVSQVWIADRYSAQQSHRSRHRTCLAHLARDTASRWSKAPTICLFSSNSGLAEPSIWPNPSLTSPPRPC
jgi:hypothetical protein